MTGGSAGGLRVNRELARAANEARIAFGMGSFRVLLRDPSRIEDFRLRDLLPDVPLLANIGGVVLRESGPRVILELAERTEADALVVHLNPGQELFQPGGDRDFRGVTGALRELISIATIPVIVKETGFGVGPGETLALLEAGAAWVDLAGAGGTNWIAVESHRLDPGPLREAAADFADWGHPTALLLAATASLLAATAGRVPPRPEGGALPLIASGGLRSGVDAAKALALGAGLVGMALPLVRAVAGEAGGRDAVLAYIERVAIGLRSAMLLTGSRTLADLRRGILRMDPNFSAEVKDLIEVDARAAK